MNSRPLLVVALLISVGAWPAPAQEGHPLTGTWSGDWGPSASSRTHITMVMAWDGKVVSGTINPGPDAIQVPAIQLDVNNWTIRFEAAAKTRTGTETIAVEGKIEDLGSPHRTLAGTWRQGSATGTFKLTRD
jgi:hypothetical protein